MKQERRRVKELERELHRKDKALAETAALLVLYPVHPIIRNSFGLMTRKLSVTSSQKMSQFLGTS